MFDHEYLILQIVTDLKGYLSLTPTARPAGLL